METGEPGIDGPASQPYVLLARWVDKNRLLFATDTNAVVSWTSLDTLTGEVQQADPPIRFDRAALDALAPDPSFMSFPELLGQVSPSGAFFLFTKTTFATEQSPGATEVHLYDLRTSAGSIILKALPGMMLQAYWAPDETAVFFDLTREGGTPLYSADTRAALATPLSPILGSEAISGEQWSVSPDGTSIAIVDKDGQLTVANLLKGTAQLLSQSAMRPSFSPDSDTVYFYSGTSLEPEESELMAYDLLSGTTETLLVPDDLALATGSTEVSPRPTTGSSYSVSPDRTEVAFYGGSLWLFQKCR